MHSEEMKQINETKEVLHHGQKSKGDLTDDSMRTSFCFPCGCFCFIYFDIFPFSLIRNDNVTVEKEIS